MKNQFFNTIKNSAGITEMLLYGSINSFSKDSITAKDFATEFNKLQGSLIKLRINSPGGDVADGIAIFNTIRNSGKTVDIYIDGIAASMASVIALSGRKLYMSVSARYMTHRVKGAGQGDADEIASAAKLVQSLENTLANIYAKKIGITSNEAKARYLQSGVDRWFTAQEALIEGLIDGIYDAAPVALAKNDKPLKMWALFNSHLQNKHKMKNEIIALLGLDATATDEEVMAAVNNLKKGQENAVNSARTSVGMAFANKLITTAEKDLYEEIVKTNPGFVMDKIVAIQKPAAQVIPSILNLTNVGGTGNQVNHPAQKPKAEWTLTDYRKHAPGELQANPELYNKLCQKEGY